LEEQQLRTTIKYEAPCFEELKGRKNSLLVLQAFVVSQTADFLETNRANFSDFLEDKNVLD
jgi:hypothetical protein